MMHGPMNVKNVYKHIIIVVLSWFLYVCVYMYVFYYYSITAGAINDNLAVVELNSVVTKISITGAWLCPL